MKSSFKKLRDFTRNKSSLKDKRSTSLDRHHQHGDDMEATTTSLQVLTDMREQYDGLLAAAHSISGSSYDFSRSIHEMASYMLETFGKIGDGDTGSSFSMLGKVQYEISKLLDLYAAHVSQTIIKPTEKLLRELESVEEIKKQYEEKRELYNQLNQQKTKNRRKKGDALEQQLLTLKEQLNDKAALLDLRFRSLRHERELSLITQAAQHHVAQVHLFGKGLNSLNAVESIIKHLSDEFRIDPTLSDGDMGNGNSYGAEVGLLGNDDDEEESMPSSPSSSHPMNAERSEHAVLRAAGAAGTPKLWENTSKSAPLHPSQYVATKSSPVVSDMDEEMLPEKEVTTYALPSPTVKFYNQVTNSGIKSEVVCSGDVPEFRRTRTGSAGSFDETRGLGLWKVGTHKPHNLGHAMAREEEMYAWKEKRSSYQVRRSPSHSHSTSFSEGLDRVSASSYAHLASTPTFSYKQMIRDNDANVGVTHSVDPLYRSGPIGRSAPWGGLAPSRVSPCASPPVSHLSTPLISELHKLPAPPPAAAPKLAEPVITYSAPLGRKPPEPARKSAVATTPTGTSSAVTVVTKSRSIPSSVNFTANLHKAKLVKADDSPVIESP